MGILGHWNLLDFTLFFLYVDHWCTPPEYMTPEVLGMTLEEWKTKFLPAELGYDFTPRASQCWMYPVSEENLPLFLSGELSPPPPDYSTTLATYCDNCWYCGDVNGWDFDDSEMRHTAVTDHEWVCNSQHQIMDLLTMGSLGTIIGTAIFSVVSDTCVSVH